MNKPQAKRIAETITRDQLALMFERAKTGVQDWRQTSAVNKAMSKGAAWNILYPCFVSGRKISQPAMTNMVWEFGDFLSADLKPAKKAKALPPSVHHESPVFDPVPLP